MNGKTKQNNIEAIVPTLPALFSALSGAALLMLAYRLLDAFGASGEVADVYIPFSFAGLFLLFLGLEGAAAGFLSAALEKKPSAFVPHVAAPLVFFAALGFGRLILGRWALPESLFTLAFYLSGFLLFRARGKKQGKKTCVLFASVPAIGLAALVFFVRLIFKYGSAGAPVATFFADIERAAETVGAGFAKALQSLAGNYAEALIKQTLTSEALQNKTVSEGYALLGEIYGASFKILLRILPAAAVGTLNIYGYVAASVCNVSSMFRRDKRVWHLTVSGAGTLLFTVSMFATALFVSLSTSGWFGVFLYSMRLVFLPVFTGIGVGTIAGMRKEQFSKHIILTVACALFIILSPLITLPMVGIYGNLTRIINNKRRQMNNGDGPELPKL